MCQQQQQWAERPPPTWGQPAAAAAGAKGGHALLGPCSQGTAPDQALGRPKLYGAQPGCATMSSLALSPHRTISAGGSGGSISSSGPGTPSRACAQATVTPPTGAAPHATAGSGAAGAPAPAQHGLESAPADAADAAAPWRCPDATLQRRIQGFLACVAASPAIQSALLSLECDGSHPPPACQPASDGRAAGEPAAGLECTLGQLLALHLRAGYHQASEMSILGTLWTLESLGSAWRSAATTCLGSYIRLLAAFSPELVRSLTRDWPGTFAKLRAGLVAAQADLLRRLGWHLMLSTDAELRPCHAWLFGGEQSLAPVCATIRRQAAALKGAGLAARCSDGGSSSSSTAAAAAQAAASSCSATCLEKLEAWSDPELERTAGQSRPAKRACTRV